MGIHKRFKSGEIGVANKHILGYQYDEEQKSTSSFPKKPNRGQMDVSNVHRWRYPAGHCRQHEQGGIRTTLGNDFQEASVRQLIFNEVYAGDIRRQKCYIEDPITKKKVPNRGELPQYYMADSHEAIIDRDTYAKVKARWSGALRWNPTYCFYGKVQMRRMLGEL